MLSNAKLQTIILTDRPDEALRFYQEILGLTLVGEADGAKVFDVGGGVLRLAAVPSMEPSEHTVMGFGVADVDAAVEWMSSRGITFERFADLPQAENGTLLTPDGARVAWFRDPDGNLLSVVQFPAA